MTKNPILSKKIKQYLNHSNTTEETAIELKRLLHFIGSDHPDDDICAHGITHLGELIDKFDGRTLSIFLQTRFGQFILEQYQLEIPLEPNDEQKMIMGLKLIQTRIQSRPETASDAPLVEYASLYLGDSIDLENPEHTQPVIELTLQNIMANRVNVRENDLRLQQELNNILDGVQATYPDEDRIQWVLLLPEKWTLN